MKKILLQYTEYNIWANDRMTATLATLTEEQANREVVSSFSSVFATALHTWSAEDIWLQRLQKAEHPNWLQKSFTGTFAEICTGWPATSRALHAFVAALQDDELEAQLSFSDRAGNPYTMPVFQVIQHVVNHASYHRGQLVTMMRQLGITTIPGTDFIGYARGL